MPRLDPEAVSPITLAFDRVNSWRENGWSGFPPVGATSLIRTYQDESGDLEPTRTDPIPMSWDLVASNTYSNIYVEDGLSVSSIDIDAISQVFDDDIYPTATYWFHPTNPYDVIDIRIYDFGDGPGNVGGFFVPSISLRNDLFVDSEDLAYSRDWSFEIVAHEFQHLLHYDLDPNEELWLNEGLADLSARVSLGPDQEGVQNHIEAYEIFPENDLLLWDEGQPPDYYETIADYGRSYAFVSYLAYHFGGRDLIVDILADPRNGLSSINGELAEDGIPERVGDILAGEKVANIIDRPGYGGDIYHQGLINISTTYEHQAWSYPDEHQISSTVKYSGYGLKYHSGSPDLAINISSDHPVDVALVGLNGSEVMTSVNISNGGSGNVMYQLSGFDVIYETLLVVPHTSVSGASIDISVGRSNLVPPETSVLVSPAEPDGDNGYYLSSPGIHLSTSEGSVVLFAWNDGEFTEYDTTLHPGEGENTLRFFAKGPLGLREDERELTFKVDRTDPEINYEISPSSPDGSDLHYISQPTVYLQSSEQGTSTFYDIGEGYEEYGEPFTLDSGTWLLSAYAEDLSGRRSELIEREIKVDLEDPTISVRTSPSEPDGNSGYYTTAPEITMLPASGSTAWFTLNGGPEMEYTGPFVLEDGEYELEAFARKPSGRTGNMETIFIKVDSTPPVINLVFDPPLCPGWCSEPTYLSVSVEDPLSSVFFTLGDEGPFEYGSDIYLNDGEYKVEVWAEDPAGNRVNSGSYDVRIDTTSPNTEILLGTLPDSGSWYYDHQPEITFRTAAEAVSPEETYFSLDGEEFVLYTGQEIELSPGRNTIHYHSKDLAGNIERTRTRDIGVDISPPVGVLSANRTLIPERGPVLFSISGSQDDNDVYRFRMEFGDGTSSGWIYDDRVEHYYSELGEYNVILVVEDTAGRLNEDEVSLKIEVLTQAEYERRLEEERSPLLLILLIVLGLILVVGTAAVAVVMIMKRRPGSEEVLEWVDEP